LRTEPRVSDDEADGIAAVCHAAQTVSDAVRRDR